MLSSQMLMITNIESDPKNCRSRETLKPPNTFLLWAGVMWQLRGCANTAMEVFILLPPPGALSDWRIGCFSWVESDHITWIPASHWSSTSPPCGAASDCRWMFKGNGPKSSLRGCYQCYQSSLLIQCFIKRTLSDWVSSESHSFVKKK